ncbi:serine/threonine protein kinase [Sorangium atrum]|uniref:non-specific serine/threonine protein kinase n=1 Tax=Sorangium atrum TaxID=2995308 RepID=A0ABT5CDV0_9BACT|nr:serine/threonine-protein kinase [Sorangium aterium]MDC0684616.1 serine/threonine-protein kinase [Sorangium aterium]
MGAEPSQALRDGRYMITRALGEGAQGHTLEAVDKRLGKLVAIKRFQIRGASSWKSVELAEREARVLASLSHPSLPAYLDHFEEDGALFLVMEKIEGESLGAMRRRSAVLGRDDILRFLRDASGVLDYLHGRAPPVIHRDIKPNNVIRRPDGSFAIVDFGAVRDRMRPEGGSTVVGTFGYMAPEQFQGRALPASDVYAVGATALCLLTGEEPENLPHRGLAIDVPAALGDRADPRLVRALSAMLEPDPDRRAARIAPLLPGLEAGDAPPERAREPAERGAHKEDRRAHKDERKEEKRARKDERREVRRARKEERRARRHEGRPSLDRGLVGLPLVAALFGLTVARIAVGLALGVIVPTVLTLLSLVFGRVLREKAAPNVRRAGRVADLALRRATRVVRGRPEPDAAAERGQDEAARVRFEEQEAPGRSRIHDGDVALEEELDELEADEHGRAHAGSRPPRAGER